MPKIAIIANTRARTNTGWALCEELIRDRPYIEVYTLGEAPLPDLVKKAWSQGYQTIVAAGGDGTISSVAHVLLMLQLPTKLGILPIGTLNHFAKDLGIPLDPASALEVIEQGHSIFVDVGCVNDRHFINNSSVGIYPYLVKARTELEKEGWTKWVAFLRALGSMLFRRFSFTVHFGKGNIVVKKKTASIFIGNNKYSFTGSRAGTRANLTEGILYIAILQTIHTLQIALLLWKTLWGTALEDSVINTTGLRSCTIRSKNKKILVSRDGEIEYMHTPLHYTLIPRALKVIVPTT